MKIVSLRLAFDYRRRLPRPAMPLECCNNARGSRISRAATLVPCFTKKTKGAARQPRPSMPHIAFFTL